MEELRKYSGRDWASVCIIAEVLRSMKECEAYELSVDLPLAASAGTLVVRAKR